MGLFNSFKKKFEDVGSNKKVKHVVDEKSNKKTDKKEKKQKKEKSSGGLTPEEIARAQAMEKGSAKPASEKGKDDQKDQKKDKKREVKTPRDTKEAFRILIKPLITEKSTYLGSERTYAFLVDPRSTKNEIAKAVQATYQVKPTSVRIMNFSGKQITSGRITGKTKDTKKALVTLPEGKSIDVYQS